MAPSLTTALSNEYKQLFADAQIRPDRLFAVNATVDRIFDKANMDRYKAVSKKTGIPAFFIGIIHNMEASLSFKGHLHNGDPLTARTVQVPKKRPPNGNAPFTWEESAIDALTFDKLSTWTDWSLPGLCFKLEGYNGWGYRKHHPQVKSPYLWSFTSIYSAGKYTADGSFSTTAVSKQVGAAALLKAMLLRKLIKLDGSDVAPAAPAAGDTPAAEMQVTGGLAVAPKPIPFPGKTLQNFTASDHVAVLQRRLKEVGIPITVDGEFGDKTEFAVRLFQARSEDTTGAPLEIDGIVGRRTWEALFGEIDPAKVPAPATAASSGASKLSARALEIAASQIGVLENPLGSNRGAEVDAYLSSVDPSLLANPWCMAFVFWCFKEAAKGLGAANSAPKSAGVLVSWRLARDVAKARRITAAEATKNPSLVIPGMVFYIDTGGGTGHTGFVSDIVNGRLSTIEGNTTLKTGSREGIGVFARAARRVESINVGFVEFS